MFIIYSVGTIWGSMMKNCLIANGRVGKWLLKEKIAPAIGEALWLNG